MLPSYAAKTPRGYMGRLATPLAMRLFKRRVMNVANAAARLGLCGSLLAMACRGADAPAPVAMVAKPAAAAGSVPKPADTAVDFKVVNDPDADYILKYPVGWTVDTQARDYDKNTNFTLFSQKNSSIQFLILNKKDDPRKVVDNAVKKIDSVEITTFSRSALNTWGPVQSPLKGVGQHLKGKIVNSFPGGIKVFCFSSPKHNILIIETYFADDLKEVQTDIDFIGGNFVMKN